MSEWKSKALGQLAHFIDYRGKTPPKTTCGIPLVTAKIVKNNVIQDPKEFISVDFYAEWMTRGIPDYGNVVFTTEAPLGVVAQIKTAEKLAFAQRVIILQGKTGVLDDAFLFYALQYEPNKKRIVARSSGTTVFGIKSAELKKVCIDVPHIVTQIRIAEILSSIDDKITLNNRINRNLEQMAQTIFKSWFVDFEPWGGVMPYGWGFEKLGNLCQSVSKTHTFDKENLIFLNTGDIDKGLFCHSNYSPVRDMPSQAKKSIHQGDILYSEKRPINIHFAFVNFDPSDDYVVSTKLMVIRTKGLDRGAVCRLPIAYHAKNNVLSQSQQALN